MGRVGQPIDVANLCLFLASDESSFITGQVIELSGGARL
jgi:NAD(P)-dependent dehydrogenase (short-subunit alcohol dehydrogenase family)